MSNKVWNWSSINEAFISLEKTDCKYAVLRSYEEIFRGGCILITYIVAMI